jgi:hypothetical protein
MSFDTDGIKNGIDNVAAHLKDAVDKIAEKTAESRERLSENAKEMARKTGDEMIVQGHKIRDAAGPQPSGAIAEKTTAD